MLSNMSRAKLWEIANERGLQVQGTGTGGYVSKEDLLRALGVTDVTPTAEPNISDLQAQIERLTAALSAAQKSNSAALQAAETTTGEKLFPLRLSLPTRNVTAFCTDARGDKKRIYLTKDNPEVMLTAGQIAEVKEKGMRLFRKGILSAPAIIPDNDNHIHSFQKFIEDLNTENVEKKVGKITATEVLWMLYAELENRSFETHDPQTGKAHRTSEGKPLAKAIRLAAHLELLKLAVQTRLIALTPQKAPEDPTGLVGGVTFASGLGVD